MSTLAKLRSQIGSAVFLKVAYGKKRPIRTAWQTLTLTVNGES